MKLASRKFRKEVFIVDDSRLVRERLVDLLSEVKDVVIVGQAGAATEAIRAIQMLRPKVVVLDISMPGGSGLLVLEEIKKSSSPPVVIMLTNFANDPYKQKCLGLGAEYFFDKSTEFDKVKEVLEHFRALRAQPTRGGKPALRSSRAVTVL